MNDKIIKSMQVNRTRPASINGINIKVKIHTGNELKNAQKIFEKGQDKAIAEYLACQFLDENNKEIFSAEYFLSGDCALVELQELTQLFMEVNTGVYNKKK